MKPWDVNTKGQAIKLKNPNGEIEVYVQDMRYIGKNSSNFIDSLNEKVTAFGEALDNKKKAFYLILRLSE